MRSSSAKASSTCASFSSSEPECGVKPHRPLLELIGLALQLTLRRWPLYATAVFAAFAVQIALALVWKVPHAIELGGAIAVPLVMALVYAFVSADAGETEIAEALVWERFLERAWAVIVIDFLLGYLAQPIFAGNGALNPLQILLGFAALVACTLTVFADAAAVSDDGVSVWMVVPRSIARSIRATWSRTILLRAMAIFLIQLLVLQMAQVLYLILLQLHVPEAAFWAIVPLTSATAAPLAAITVVVYRDAANVLV